MADLGTAVSLLVATVELAQIRSIRSAVRANLIAAGGVPGPLGTIRMPHPPCPTRSLDPAYRIEPRRVYHPTPAYAPRQVVRLEPKVEPAPFVPAVDAAYDSRCDARLEHGPLAPPWRMPLPATPSACRPVIKCRPKPPDVINRGSLIDFFM